MKGKREEMRRRLHRRNRIRNEAVPLRLCAPARHLVGRGGTVRATARVAPTAGNGFGGVQSEQEIMGGGNGALPWRKPPFILISDRKVGKDFRDRIVSGEAKPAEHNGDIWSRASTKHGAILAGKNPRFLLDISIMPQGTQRKNYYTKGVKTAKK